MSVLSDRPFCQTCRHIYSSMAKLRRHMKEVHQHVKEFRCLTCSKDFLRKENLERHNLQSHSIDALKEYHRINRKILKQLGKKTLCDQIKRSIVKKKFPQCYELLTESAFTLELLKTLQERQLHITDVVDIEKAKEDSPAFFGESSFDDKEIEKEAKETPKRVLRPKKKTNIIPEKKLLTIDDSEDSLTISESSQEEPPRISKALPKPPLPKKSQKPEPRQSENASLQTQPEPNQRTPNYSDQNIMPPLIQQGQIYPGYGPIILQSPPQMGENQRFLSYPGFFMENIQRYPSPHLIPFGEPLNPRNYIERQAPFPPQMVFVPVQAPQRTTWPPNGVSGGDFPMQSGFGGQGSYQPGFFGSGVSGFYP